ncbi:MAG: glycosyltransferase family 39 protein [Deltaproteobacteria bacterium]|nr:glycosyltransferase family 39 protein [Deltaproteobacteria bacterium]
MGYFNKYYGKYRFEFYLILLSVSALFIHLHLASTLNIGNDEAHYFVWSLKPAPGYLDDAPFTSYVIYFFTGLFGKSELNVRMGAVIFSFLDGFLIYCLTYTLFRNKRASFFAFMFFLSTVIFGTVLSVMMLPDAPLLFFYLCFLIAFHKSLGYKNKDGDRFKKWSNPDKPDKSLLLWILTGVFLGFAFLSKYTAALIPPSALLYLLLSNKNRTVLKTFYPYLALAIALLVFLPVVYWNSKYNFISFRFQLSHGFSHPKPVASLFIDGLLGQFLVITPFIYLFLIWTFGYSIKKFIPGWLNMKSGGGSGGLDIAEGILYSVCLSLPVLVFFIVNGYFHRILVHWPDIGYMAAFPVMGYVADRITGSGSHAKQRGTLILKAAGSYVYFAIFFGFFLSFVLYNQIYYNLIPVRKIIRYIDKEKNIKKSWVFSLIPHIPGSPETADIINDLFGWKRGAKYVGIVYKDYKAAYHPLFILTHHYAIADELIYYGGYEPAVNIYNISGFLNQYDLWQNLNKINKENAIFIMDNKYMINPARIYGGDFKSIQEIGRLDIYVKFRLIRVYYLYLMKDFDAKRAITHIKKSM